tara:strand:+ start:3604 stop:3756 length:153 start_codon:yes stop_codon:yes gene_type:complete
VCTKIFVFPSFALGEEEADGVGVEASERKEDVELLKGESVGEFSETMGVC